MGYAAKQTNRVEEVAVVHVCHKCGGVRWIEPAMRAAEAGLIPCRCLGQTTFDYEMVPRTVTEAKELAMKCYHKFVKLYEDQQRDARDFKRLKEEYGITE